MDIDTIKTTYNTEVETLKSQIEKEQTDYIKKNPKYKQVFRTTDGNLEKEVHEYLCPDGSTGYQVFFYKDKFVKSVGYGKEAEHRTHDWLEIKSLII